MTRHLLLVEDDTNFGTVLKDFLELKGFRVTLAQDGTSGYSTFRSGKFDLCILDVMMPYKDGFTLAEDIRGHDKQVPIVFLTARNMKEDMIRGYQVGADDYVTKPFDTELLLYKIQAIINRSQLSSPHESKSIFELGNFNFNSELRILKYAETEHKLSPKENALLKMLCNKQNEVLKRDDALVKIWKESNYFTARSMDVYVTRLRKLLKTDEQISIINIHGDGFRLVIEA